MLDTAITCEYFARPSLAALARQYFRYGWWKGRMLRQHPRSIRIRQAVPALFLPVGLLLAVAAVLAPMARPFAAALGAAYVAAIGAAAIHAAAGQWRLVVPVAAAFLTIHSTWSAGISSFFLTGASALPRRQPGGRRPRAGLTGVQLGVALTVIFLLSVVLPWSMASSLRRDRIARARGEVGAIAAALQAAGAARQPAYQPDAVLVGPGANPEIPAGSDWRQVTSIGASAAHLDLPIAPDPWGNHYFDLPVAGVVAGAHPSCEHRPLGPVGRSKRHRGHPVPPGPGSRRARRRRHRRAAELIVLPMQPHAYCRDDEQSVVVQAFRPAMPGKLCVHCVRSVRHEGGPCAPMIGFSPPISLRP